ncbi:MAG TPA: hypothetical protein VM431_11870, partial [Phycisphaerae bacterium]|nr:hypothetical protein [Phycisphaerae bacterium]
PHGEKQERRRRALRDPGPKGRGYTGLRRAKAHEMGLKAQAGIRSHTWGVRGEYHFVALNDQPGPVLVCFSIYRLPAICAQNGTQKERFRRIPIKNRKKRSKTARFPLPILPKWGPIGLGAPKTVFGPSKRPILAHLAE